MPKSTNLIRTQTAQIPIHLEPAELYELFEQLVKFGWEGLLWSAEQAIIAKLDAPPAANLRLMPDWSAPYYRQPLMPGEMFARNGSLYFIYATDDEDTYVPIRRRRPRSDSDLVAGCVGYFTQLGSEPELNELVDSILSTELIKAKIADTGAKIEPSVTTETLEERL